MNTEVSSSSGILHLPSFIEIAKPNLRPPVSNKIVFDGPQLKVMIVGGPNSRSDYHLNMGEELFFQLQGNNTATYAQNTIKLN